MAGYNPLNVGFTAGEDITAGQVVYISDDNTVSVTTGASNAVVGVAYVNADSGDKVTVQTDGVVEVTASAAITVGSPVVSANNGQVAAYDDTSNTPDQIIGIALEGASDANDKIDILLK